jgi:hypothetical protein
MEKELFTRLKGLEMKSLIKEKDQHTLELSKPFITNLKMD